MRDISEGHKNNSRQYCIKSDPQEKHNNKHDSIFMKMGKWYHLGYVTQRRLVLRHAQRLGCLVAIHLDEKY
jgi:hypothetical protein